MHDGLEHDRTRLLECLEPALAPAGDECNFLGIHWVMLAIEHRHAQVLQRKSGERAFGQNLPDALLPRRDELSGNGSPNYLVYEFEPPPTLQRLHAQGHLTKLSRASRLLL